MLDVVFIMLIFFIVTASFVNETGLNVDRPPTTDQPPPDSANTNIVFRVSESNDITLEGRRIDIRSVVQMLSAYMLKNQKQKLL